MQVLILCYLPNFYCFSSQIVLLKRVRFLFGSFPKYAGIIILPKTFLTALFNLISGFLTLINCYNVKWVTRVQDTFTAAKMLALLVTFIGSLWYLFSGHTENLQNMMEGTNTSPSAIAIAFYTGLFSYSGWNYLNFVTEELKDPYR